MLKWRDDKKEIIDNKDNKDNKENKDNKNNKNNKDSYLNCSIKISGRELWNSGILWSVNKFTECNWSSWCVI